MKTLLMAQGLWDLVQNGYQQPKDATEFASWDESKRKQFEKDQKRDSTTLSILHRGVAETIFPIIMATTTAMEA